MSEDHLWPKDQPDDLLSAPDRPRRQRKRSKVARLAQTWAKIPHHRGLELAKRAGDSMLAVLLVLEHIIHEAHSNRIKLTNDLLKQYGITRQSKTRGLRKLAAAEVISVEQHGLEAPIVTRHWYTKGGELRKGRVHT
jgi:hypothetical protein